MYERAKGGGESIINRLKRITDLKGMDRLTTFIIEILPKLLKIFPPNIEFQMESNGAKQVVSFKL